MQKRYLIALCLATAACGRARPAAAPPAPLLPAVRKWLAVVDGPFGALATDGSRVIVATAGDVRALDRTQGAELWRRDGLTGAVAAAPGLVVVLSPTGSVTSLTPQTGTTRWSIDTGSTGSLPPRIEGARIVLAGSRVVALDAATGKILLTEPLTAPAVTPPVQAGPCILVGEADSALRCRDSQTGLVRWSFLMERPLEAPPVVDRDRVFLGTADRRVVSLDLRKGNTDWTFKIGTGVSVAPVVAGELVLVASDEGVLYAFGRGNGHMRWRAALPSRPLMAPIVAGDEVLIASHPNDLRVFALGTAKAGGTSQAGVDRLDPLAGVSEIRVPPLVVERSIVVGVRNPSGVLLLEPGTPPKAPDAPAPFGSEGDPLATPTPAATPTALPNP